MRPSPPSLRLVSQGKLERKLKMQLLKFILEYFHRPLDGVSLQGSTAAETEFTGQNDWGSFVMAQCNGTEGQ